MAKHTLQDWETVFRAWAKPPSDTEEEKMENAERMVRDAIRASSALAQRSLEVFPQGSYRNSTNVRHDSDVDICVLCTDVFFFDLTFADGMTKEQLQITDASYSYGQFKNDVQSALVAKFGSQDVTRGKKAFDVHANSYRVDADVVACFEHRRYNRSGGHSSGTEFLPDNGGEVINWPRQHYENGVAKNGGTGNRFKFITRVLKRLRNEMADDGIAKAMPIPSFLIECLVWNVPNGGFQQERYSDDVRSVLVHTFNNTMTDEKCREWGEVNEMKYLFRAGQPWTRDKAHAFLGAAWEYIGFE